jgi:cytochrome c peroxidase
MNTRYLILLLLSLCVIFTQCKSSNKITYNFPTTLSKPQRDELLEKCQKGKELFKANCSECHGIFTKGKDKIPNFTSEQIDNYSARFLRHDPKNHAVTKEMSPDQMNDVLMFLRFRNVKKTDKAPVAGTPKGR